MTENVVSLHGNPVAAGGVATEVVELLESLLLRAKSGEIAAIAVATISRRNCPWHGSAWSKPAELACALGGAILALQHRYGAGMEDCADA